MHSLFSHLPQSKYALILAVVQADVRRDRNDATKGLNVLMFDKQKFHMHEKEREREASKFSSGALLSNWNFRRGQGIRWLARGRGRAECNEDLLGDYQVNEYCQSWRCCAVAAKKATFQLALRQKAKRYTSTRSKPSMDHGSRNEFFGC